MSELLSNPRAERVRTVARLSGRPARRRAGLFLAEGPQAVREAVPAGAVRDLYVTPEAAQRHPEIVAAARERGVVGAPVHRRGARRDGRHRHAAGPAGRVHPRRPAAGRGAGRGPQLVAVLAHVRDPGNAGTVLRAADAAGADAVVLTDASVDPYNPKCVRSTAGSLFHLDLVTGPTLGDAVAGLRAAGLAVLAADGAGEHDLDDLQDAAERGEGPLVGPVAWVLGNEAWGLPDADRALADLVVRVPVHGRAESLNLATAATVCLYAAARAAPPRRADRRPRGPRAPGTGARHPVPCAHGRARHTARRARSAATTSPTASSSPAPTRSCWR